MCIKMPVVLKHQQFNDSKSKKTVLIVYKYLAVW